MSQSSSCHRLATAGKTQRTLLARAALADASAQDEPFVCRQFSALYELTQPLGRGSFKTTYLARERRGSGARVAVSVLNKERAGTTVEHNLHLIEQEVCCDDPPAVVILVRLQTNSC